VAGNTLVLLSHELGHVLIAEMRLPLLGREEDAADTPRPEIARDRDKFFPARTCTSCAGLVPE
jgi:hypothetical protein